MNRLVTQVLNDLVDEIEAGTVPWQKSWRTGLPHNQVTLRSYHGVNVLMLWVQMLKHNYRTNGWATLKQWNSIGVKVREGENGTPVLFYKVMNEDDEERRYSFIKCSWAYNVDQVEGFEVPAYDVDYRPDLEEFVSSLRIPIKRGGGEPSYSYTKDEIYMPLITAFGSEDDYYVTLLHEIAHATGHKSRLDRPMVGMGSIHTDAEQRQLYAAEELTAEMCAAFCGAHLRLNQDQHASYLASWLKSWPKDKRAAALYFAAKHAGKAFDWIIEHGSVEQPTFLEAAE